MPKTWSDGSARARVALAPPSLKVDGGEKCLKLT